MRNGARAVGRFWKRRLPVLNVRNDVESEH
jgi:hypothetical protein